MSKVLVDDHAELDQLLEGAFAAIETGNASVVFDRVDLFWARLAMHIRAEHLHLFPAILNAVREDATDLRERAERKINELQDDHNFFMRELLSAIKILRGPETDLTEIRKLLKNTRRRLDPHNAIEETEVYGWAEKFLDPADNVELQAAMQRELENLPPRFAAG